MWSEEEVQRVVEIAKKCLGIPYAIGEKGPDGNWIVRGKPSISNPNPTEFDCSGFARWIVAQGRGEDGKVTVLPHGCIEQLKFCEPLGTQRPRPLDLGFADLRGGDHAPDHVVVCVGGGMVIEARGYQKGKDYNKVIERPISAWENQAGFLGWWAVPGLWK